MKYVVFLLLPIIFLHPAFAQSSLPIIKASSKTVSIRDGGYLDKNAWNLSPKTRPDIYTADRTRKTKWVVFYTDIDSIKVKVKPGSRFNFIVLLNGKDSCYTQIASAIPPDNTPADNNIAAADTIPFVLTAFNAISVKAVINNTDSLTLHFDTGSWDLRLTKDAILKKTNLLPNQSAAVAGTANPDYNHLNRVFKVQMGKMVWNDPVIGVTGFTAHDMDGRFGWNLFENKTVEINYDHNLLIIRNGLPKTIKGYVKSKIGFIRSFVCAKAVFEIEGNSYSGNFLLDTGSDQAVLLDSNWAAKQGFPSNLKLIKTSSIKDPRGVKYETKIVQSPLLKVNGWPLTNIPTYLLGGRNPVGIEINYLGNDLLKRFNIVLDFKHDDLYLKPNKLLGLAYRENI